MHDGLSGQASVHYILGPLHADSLYSGSIFQTSNTLKIQELSTKTSLLSTGPETH